MVDIVSALSRIPNIKTRSSATEQDVVNAEQFLCLKFAPEYRLYLKAFGAISVNGREITGICKSKRLHVVEATLEALHHNKVPNNWYVIEQLNIGGILIWQDSNGNIYQTAPGCESKRIASSLLEYIKT